MIFPFKNLKARAIRVKEKYFAVYADFLDVQYMENVSAAILQCQ